MVPHRIDEARAVRGIPHRARRGDPDPIGAEGPSAAAELREDLDRAGKRLRIEPPGRIHARAEAGDRHVAGKLSGSSRIVLVRAWLGDEQPDRVGPLIDRGDAPAGSVWVDRLDLGGGPRPDGIDATGEVVRVVRVQALDTRARSGDPAGDLLPADELARAPASTPRAPPPGRARTPRPIRGGR